MTAMLLLGAFIGCIFMPYLADRISRKWALTVVVVIFDIGAIIQTAAQSYGALVAGRAIGGIGVGTLAMVCKHLRFEVFFLKIRAFVRYAIHRWRSLVQGSVGTAIYLYLTLPASNARRRDVLSLGFLLR